MRTLWHIIVKEFLQLRHDRRMIPMIVIGPIAQLIAFGYAANTDVTDVPLLLVDQDQSAASRALVERFVGSGTFDLVGSEASVRSIDPWLIDGRAQVVLVIGSDYGEAIAAGRAPELQVIADGSDANSTQIGLGYANRIVAELGLELVQHQLEAGATAAPGAGRVGAVIELVPRVWYNPDLKSRWFYVPAVVAMVLMLMTMILSSMGVVREKEIGTMEQLIVTPIRAWQLIVGKLFPFAVMGLVVLFSVTAIAVWYFEVPLRGSLWLLLALTGLFLLTTLGLGLLVSTLVRTQQQAMLSSVFLLMVPMIYLSGLIFPIENMPAPIQTLTYAIPLRYYAVILRGVFLKGSGLDVLWPESLILAGFGIGIVSLAALRFRKRLD
ncbi:MAG TPA: ABC transporter permease [Acidobacteriota bacterium]